LLVIAENYSQISSPNDDLRFGNMKPSLCINVLFIPSSSMLDAFDRVVKPLVPFFHLCPVIDGCLDDMGKYWFHIFSLLFENMPEHWKIILDAVIAASCQLIS
jgi:hypothetical protein